jgi:hypothetical protein
VTDGDRRRRIGRPIHTQWKSPAGEAFPAKQNQRRPSAGPGRDRTRPPQRRAWNRLEANELVPVVTRKVAHRGPDFAQRMLVSCGSPLLRRIMTDKNNNTILEICQRKVVQPSLDRYRLTTAATALLRMWLGAVTLLSAGHRTSNESSVSL